MLRSIVVRSYDSESLDDVLVSLQERGCSVTEVRSVELNTSPNNLSLKCNGFLILYDDPFVYQNDEEEDKPNDEDLTNEEKFLRDWGRRPIHPNVVGSLAYEYVCPAITGLPFDQKMYNPETGLCSADDLLSSGCHECKKRFWKSKYKKPEKKED